VDTFFFMSGLLAMEGVLQKFTLTPKNYAKLVIGRYIRLTPAYAAVLFFFVKVMPYQGLFVYF
jgi:peptidoglycan/LPS O-acetylase OafA/YrhL